MIEATVAKNEQSQTGRATVSLLSDTIIECVLEGGITGKVVEKSVRETKELVTLVRARGHKPRLLIDMHKLISQDSEARSRSKDLVSLGFEKVAICGANRTLKTIGQYIVRIAGMQDYTRFIQNRPQALAWLEQDKLRVPLNKSRILKLCASITSLIGIATLIGWATHNEVIAALSPAFKAMNPITALGFTVTGVAIFILSLKKQLPLLKACVGLIALWLFIYGSFVAARHLFGLPSGIDTWLFTEKIYAANPIARASLGTAILFITTSLLLLLTVVGVTRTWLRYAFRLLVVVSALPILSALVGYAFGVDNLYTLTNTPMPLTSSIGFVLIVASVVSVAYTPALLPYSSPLHTYGRGVLVFAVIALLTGISWQQANNNSLQYSDIQARQAFDKTHDAIVGRIGSYTDALYGFKAFFESSSFVSATEYQRYFHRSELQKNYPGFSTISFIRVVEPSERQKFIKEIQSQEAGFPTFKKFPFPPQSSQTQYIATYIEPFTPTTTFGSDIALLPGRLGTFEKARDSGAPAASDIITFNAADGATEEGFIISIPIYTHATQPQTVSERRDAIYGFVNTVFRSKIIFEEIFKSIPADNTTFRITSTQGNKLIYQSNDLHDEAEFSTPRLAKTVDIAGQTWNIAMETDEDFGTTRFTRSVPRTILVSGLLLAGLAGILVVSISRRREEALALASSMTEDLNNERTLSETVRKKDEAILASIGDAVFAIDTQNQITLFNPAAAKISGYSEQEALGKPYNDILHFVNSSGSPNYSFIKRALKGHLSSMKSDTRLIRKNGSFIDIANSAAPIIDSEGVLQGAIVVFRDVSSERALEQAKSEFVSLASHQLRTPLSAINWYSEMMLDQDTGKLTKDQQEYMKEIYEGNQRMIELVDSLLNVSRLEVGKLKNDPQDVSMVELADSLEKEMQTSIITKNLTLTRNIQPKLPIVSADPKLVRMIVQNLLSNAVKYTPPKGKVTLTMHKATEDEIKKAGIKDTGNFLFISVSDTGYGIPKEQQGKIFEKLFRADNVRKMDVEGTGLGLYIVKEVAKKLGGDIWFESTESIGTTFYVVIPFKTKPS